MSEAIARKLEGIKMQHFSETKQLFVIRGSCIDKVGDEKQSH